MQLSHRTRTLKFFGHWEDLRSAKGQSEIKGGLEQGMDWSNDPPRLERGRIRISSSQHPRITNHSCKLLEEMIFHEMFLFFWCLKSLAAKSATDHVFDKIQDMSFDTTLWSYPKMPSKTLVILGGNP
jgi:hypothetical protein